MSNQEDALAPPKKNGKKKRFSLFGSRRKSKVEQQTKKSMSSDKTSETFGSNPAAPPPQDSPGRMSLCVKSHNHSVMIDPETDPFLRKFARKSHIVTVSTGNEPPVRVASAERSLPMTMEEEIVEEKPEEETAAVPEETQENEQGEGSLDKDEDGKATEGNEEMVAAGAVGAAGVILAAAAVNQDEEDKEEEASETSETEGSAVPEESQEEIEKAEDADGAEAGEQEGIEQAEDVGGAVAGGQEEADGVDDTISGEQEEIEKAEDADGALAEGQEETGEVGVENAEAGTEADATEIVPPPPIEAPETPKHEKHMKLSMVATLAQNFVAVDQQNHELNEKNKVKNSTAHKIPSPKPGKKVVDPPVLPPPETKEEEVKVSRTPVRAMKKEYSMQVHQHKKHQEDITVKNSTAAKFKNQVTSKTSKTHALMAFKLGGKKAKDAHTSELGVSDSIQEHEEEA